MNEDKLKIVVFGAFGAGKTTLIRTLDPSSMHVEAEGVGGSTTIALDFGKVEIDGRHVYLLGHRARSASSLPARYLPGDGRGDTAYGCDIAGR